MAVAICERSSRKPAAEETVSACQEWRSGCRQRFPVTTVDRQVRRGGTEQDPPVLSIGRREGLRRLPPRSRTAVWRPTGSRREHLDAKTPRPCHSERCAEVRILCLRREPQKRPANSTGRRQPVSASVLRPAPAGTIAACRDGGTEDFQNTINPGYPPISAVHAIIAGVLRRRVVIIASYSISATYR